MNEGRICVTVVSGRVSCHRMRWIGCIVCRVWECCDVTASRIARVSVSSRRRRLVSSPVKSKITEDTVQRFTPPSVKPGRMFSDNALEFVKVF